jgi:hypothetical protein
MIKTSAGIVKASSFCVIMYRSRVPVMSIKHCKVLPCIESPYFQQNKVNCLSVCRVFSYNKIMLSDKILDFVAKMLERTRGHLVAKLLRTGSLISR